MTRPAILVTGAARRIGAAIARKFGAEGWHVVIHYGGSRDAAEQLAASLPSAEAIQCDIADPDAAVAMVEALAARLPEWRVLVNCASVFEDQGAGLPSPEAHARTMRINAEVPTRMAQAFLAASQAEGGRRVIAITDQKLANPNPDFFSYTMSKQALASTVPMLAQNQAGATDRPGDRIYAIAPGAILPSYDQSEEEFTASGKLNLLKRHTGKEEIADTAYFLAQGWVASGATIFVDSGQHLLAQSRDVLYLAREGARP
jgi:NAD(P)-dependent dehydrogenase (short-subunit alcohol dehydrogenase family)